MKNQQQNEPTKPSRRLIDAEKTEPRTKADIERKVARILELIKNENKNRNPETKSSKRDPELVMLIEDFLKQYQLLHALYDRLKEDNMKNDPERNKGVNSPSANGSDSEYFSSEEADDHIDEGNNQCQLSESDLITRKLEDGNQELTNLKNSLASVEKEREALKSEYMVVLSKIQDAENLITDLRIEGDERKRELLAIAQKHAVLQDEASTRTKELESLHNQVKDLKMQVQTQATEAKQMQERNKELHAHIEELESELESMRRRERYLDVPVQGQATGDKVMHKRNKELHTCIRELKSELESSHRRERDLEAQARNQATQAKQMKDKNIELQAGVTELESELESLQHHKRDLEVQVHSLAAEAKQLKEENIELRIHITELELISQDQENEISNLVQKLNGSENSATCRIAELEEQVRGQQMELSSLVAEKRLMEETVERLREELPAHDKMSREIKALHEELKCLESQRVELVSQLQDKDRQIDQHLIQIQTLKEELTSDTEEKKMIFDENNHLAEQFKDMKLKMDSLRGREVDLLEQVRNHVHEMERMRNEKEELEAKFIELERKSIERGNDLSTLQEKLKADSDAYSTNISPLTARVKNLQEEVDSLQALNRQLQSQNGKDMQPSSQRRYIPRNESKSNEQDGTTHRIAKKCRLARTSSQEPMDAQVLEKRMEELAEEFRRTFEDNLRILCRRILVLEQLHMENKDGYKMIKERFQRENEALEEQAIVSKAELAKISEASLLVNDELGRFVSIASNFDEQSAKIMIRLSKMSKDVQYMRKWVLRANKEVGRPSNDVVYEIIPVDGREKKGFSLNEMDWNLQAKVDEDMVEKLQMRKLVDRLEKRVADLENIAKAREEVLFRLVHEKKEAIRQLCNSIDYYRSRCSQYWGVLSKIAAQRRRAT